MKLLLNVRIACASALRRCMFGVTNLKSIFLSWKLLIRVLEDSLSSFLRRIFDTLVARLLYNVSYSFTIE